MWKTHAEIGCVNVPLECMCVKARVRVFERARVYEMCVRVHVGLYVRVYVCKCVLGREIMQEFFFYL